METFLHVVVVCLVIFAFCCLVSLLLYVSGKPMDSAIPKKCTLAEIWRFMGGDLS